MAYPPVHLLRARLSKPGHPPLSPNPSPLPSKVPDPAALLLAGKNQLGIAFGCLWVGAGRFPKPNQETPIQAPGSSGTPSQVTLGRMLCLNPFKPTQALAAGCMQCNKFGRRDCAAKHQMQINTAAKERGLA